jgi:hypothetical protein
VARPAPSVAGYDVGVRAGYYFDADAVSLGMEVLTPLPISESESWFFNPNVEVAMGDTRDLTSFNLDVHYDFPTTNNMSVWAGAGPALYVIDRDQFTDDTDVDPALNLLVGLGAKTGGARPFVQGKGVLMDNSEVELAVGVRF